MADSGVRQPTLYLRSGSTKGLVETLLDNQLVANATAACNLGRKPCRYRQIWLAAKARSPRRKPWVTECLRELSREAATAICA